MSWEYENVNANKARPISKVDKFSNNNIWNNINYYMERHGFCPSLLICQININNVRSVAPSCDWTNDFARRPSSAAYCGSSRQRRTKRSSSAASANCTAAFWASMAWTMSLKFQVFGPNEQPRRRRPVRSCSARRDGRNFRPQRRFARFPTRPQVRPPRRRVKSAALLGRQRVSLGRQFNCRPNL